MQTLLSFMNIVFPIFCNSILKNWHSFEDILSLFFYKAFSISSNFATCYFFDGVNNNRSSIIVSQYFLLCQQSNIAFIYDCQIEGEIFNPIGILWYKYDALPKYGNIPQYLFEFSDGLNEWNA